MQSYKICSTLVLLTSVTLSVTAMDKNTSTASDDTTPLTTTVTPAVAPVKDPNALTDTSKPLIIQQKINQQIVTFTIRLAANNTTGFQWFITGYDQNLVHPVHQQYIANPKKLLGSPGISVWEFQVKPLAFAVPHVMHIQFEYRRPWEAAFANRTSFTVITEPAAPQHKNGT